jgi:hypothetical protein
MPSNALNAINDVWLRTRQGLQKKTVVLRAKEQVAEPQVKGHLN